jgi:fatty acid desaturase
MDIYRLVISAVISAILVLAVFMLRAWWWFNVKDISLRILLLVVLWLCVTFLIFRKCPDGGDQP